MRQKYIDTTVAEVDTKKFELCQIKYDGIWCLARVKPNHTIEYYSRNGQIKKTERCNRTPVGEYVGELMYGSQWAKQHGREGTFFVFDVKGAIDETYAERYKRLRYIFLDHKVPRQWTLVDNYCSNIAPIIWENQVVTQKIEGLVFRSARQVWHEPLLRAKYESEIDLNIVGYTRGKLGKFANTLGAIEAKCADGVFHTVGGGFSDELRHEIWQNREKFLGRTFVATYKKKFDSGKLRHPNFSRWHLEK